MADHDSHSLLRQLITGDPAEVDGLVPSARTTSDPLVLVAAALAGPSEGDLLAQALRLATSAGDRQVIAVAQAFLAGDTDRVQALAREHLVDHPDSVLVAWLAGSQPPSLAARSSGTDPTHAQEESCTARSPLP